MCTRSRRAAVSLCFGDQCGILVAAIPIRTPKHFWPRVPCTFPGFFLWEEFKCKWHRVSVLEREKKGVVGRKMIRGALEGRQLRQGEGRHVEERLDQT